MPIKRLFVANRGEIALRVLRTAKRLGIETVIGVSAADRNSWPATFADRAVVLGPAPAAKSYLDVKLVVHAAHATGCDALHPGYGFLSEKPALSRLCEDNGIAFVGPRAETIETLGDKLSARRIAHDAGVATVPGTDRIDSVAAALGAADTLGYPVVMKASAGGGGKGMFLARSTADIRAGFDRSSREALAAFGDGTLYIERYVETARHVEVQVVGDGTGTVIHFGDRDCSSQRRYQKLVEEAQAVAMPVALREKLHAAAVKFTAFANYRSAGTCEFLYDVAREDFYFMELNSRIQVEHPVTEMVTGEDLIARQLSVAAGDGVGVTQQDVHFSGHAIEVRINAEDPKDGFRPSPGRITAWEPPTGTGVRLDTAVRVGDVIPPFYDSMIGKLIACAPTRDEAIDRMLRAIAAFRVEGPKTTLPLARFIVAHPDFRTNHISTHWLEDTVLPAFLKE
ncbi:MAG: ATP-grasp domain-containing protein [Nevskiaceae bacterium]|nr:MAG: ATP-grasp domain-containing protein [Nevskiaceae bacterium]TBR73630.1 MAG: ATP-grasp domain-containing protein [Nevskiaceae bacterium]